MDSSTNNMDTSAACSNDPYHETPRRCASGCGFFGTAENQGLCSLCYKRHLNKAKAINAAHEKEITEIGCALSSLKISKSESPASTPRQSRCSVCRKRLGLLGFVCRCGASYCGVHRHPEAHGCLVDFKEAGKIAIQKENPICKADKMIHRI